MKWYVIEPQHSSLVKFERMNSSVLSLALPLFLAATHPGGVLLSDNGGRGASSSSYLPLVRLRWDLNQALRQKSLLQIRGRKSSTGPKEAHEHRRLLVFGLNMEDKTKALVCYCFLMAATLNVHCYLSRGHLHASRRTHPNTHTHACLHKSSPWPMTWPHLSQHAACARKAAEGETDLFVPGWFFPSVLFSSECSPGLFSFIFIVPSGC